MLEILSKNNELWLKMALQICRDEDTAKDLVQDMYLKLYDVNKELSNSYIYFTLKSIYTDQVKESSLKNRIVLINDFSNFDNDFEVYDLDFDKEVQNDIDMINEALSTCGIYKAIVADSFLEGLRKVSRNSGIAINTVQKHRKYLKETAWKRKQKE
jgi:hypothetical protein